MVTSIVLLSLIFFNCSVNAASWQELLKEKKLLSQDSIYQTIKEQYAAYVCQDAPVIADPRIKSIPIVEKGEPLIDVWKMNHSRIIMLPSAPNNQSFSAPIYNSGLSSASKMRAGLWEKLEKMLIGLDDLSESFGYKQGTIAIKVFEGLRDLETQQRLFNNKADEIKTKNPDMSDEEVQTETAKWVSPTKNNVPVHSTGAAVDIRLWNTITNDFVDMGPFGVIWGTNKEAPTFSENLSDAQKLNRLFLLMAATKAGLVNYVYEYWHYSIGDRYAAYWQEKDARQRNAYYGSVAS